MRVIIYGVGKKYSELCDEFEKNEIEIVGITDSDDSVWGKKIVCGKRTYEIRNIDEFAENVYDKVVITTKKYYKEIRECLVEKGVQREQILLAETMFHEIYLEKLYHIEHFRDKFGLEIGGPSNLFSYIYSRIAGCDGVNFCLHTTWDESGSEVFKYENKILGNSFIMEATDMCLINDESYDFVLSSNNLEHIANPLKALGEFARVVKMGGPVLVMVPMKDMCFDHNREYTTFEHLKGDYLNDVGEDDLTHLKEIIENHDYDMDVACGGREKFIVRAKKNIENRCLHHHVFEEDSLRKAFDFVGLEVISFSEEQGNWLIIGQKVKKG